MIEIEILQLSSLVGWQASQSHLDHSHMHSLGVGINMRRASASMRRWRRHRHHGASGTHHKWYSAQHCPAMPSQPSGFFPIIIVFCPLSFSMFGMTVDGQNHRAG